MGKAVDISNFVNNLPFGKDTTCFSSMDASGSTSQATNIVEVIECGANALLIDEDTCATNFMIRDDKMMQLVAADKEPITPFVRIVRSLYEDCQVSSVMVIGGTGDYFDVADNVLVMDSYKCYDATERAKAIVASSAKSSTSSHTTSQSVKFRSTNCKRFILLRTACFQSTNYSYFGCSAATARTGHRSFFYRHSRAVGKTSG